MPKELYLTSVATRRQTKTDDTGSRLHGRDWLAIERQRELAGHVRWQLHRHDAGQHGIAPHIATVGVAFSNERLPFPAVCG